MKNFIFFTILILPNILHAEPVYKCKPSEDLTAYSDAPCKAASNKKINVKENTLDHSQLRKDKNYVNALPKSIDQTSSANGGVSIVPMAKGGGYRESSSIANETTNSVTSNPGGGANAIPAVTTQPWQ